MSALFGSRAPAFILRFAPRAEDAISRPEYLLCARFRYCVAARPVPNVSPAILRAGKVERVEAQERHYTPLMSAAHAGNLPVVKLLLDRGA